MTAAAMSRRRQSDPFERPLDHALLRLRAHGLPYKWHAVDFARWDAVCPVCLTGDWGLTIRERGRGGAIDLHCAAGCDSVDVAAALERDPADLRVEEAERRAKAALAAAEAARALAAHAINALAVACRDDRRMWVAA